MLDGKILITGGTGSLGKVVLRRLLKRSLPPYRIVVFSRDEAKHSDLRALYSMDKELKELFESVVRFQVGDVRDQDAVFSATAGVDTIIHAAALKQVPSCEYSPYEAVETNIMGAENIIRAVEKRKYVTEVIGISTDKACKPVNVMGMTKAIQERLLLGASERCPNTHFKCVRYGNVLASRGSVIPLFQEQIKNGGPVTITTSDMTRFLLSLDQAVDTVFDAHEYGRPGETFIPRIPSARIIDVAEAMTGTVLGVCKKNIPIHITGIRPGEKIHEILVSEEEASRTYPTGKYFVIKSVLNPGTTKECLTKEFSSEDCVMSYEAVVDLLKEHGFIND
ncbi:Polysaccharide biosynthesis protein [uncultured archaeon]|nr:Polysaccharide biosynthesis protein [uncultured archaeon]